MKQFIHDSNQHFCFPEAVKNSEGGEEKSDFSGDSITENGSVIVNHDISENHEGEEPSNVITTTAEISQPQSQTIGEYKQ